MTATASNRS